MNRVVEGSNPFSQITLRILLALAAALDAVVVVDTVIEFGLVLCLGKRYLDDLQLPATDVAHF